MREIAERIWHEPAVFIGLLTSVLIALLTVLGDNGWDAETVLAVIAPFFSSLGIRQLVTPVGRASG